MCIKKPCHHITYAQKIENIKKKKKKKKGKDEKKKKN
jgi:hypothetical protein